MSWVWFAERAKVEIQRRIEVIGGALVLLQVALLILFAPSLAAGLVSAEREGGGWQLLRMTPLSPGAILRGKLLSVAWPLALLLCATLPGYVVMMTVKPELVPQVERVVVCLGLTAVEPAHPGVCRCSGDTGA